MFIKILFEYVGSTTLRYSYCVMALQKQSLQNGCCPTEDLLCHCTLTNQWANQKALSPQRQALQASLILLALGRDIGEGAVHPALWDKRKPGGAGTKETKKQTHR